MSDVSAMILGRTGVMGIYSDDDEFLETRMKEIRDDPQNRVKRMARQRVKVGRQSLPFHDIELLWILEADRSERIPLLCPAEYWAMIRGLSVFAKAVFGCR